MRDVSNYMPKIIFKTFQEASVFAKNLAMTIKSSASVKRDGDIWYIEDPRAEQGTAGTAEPINTPAKVAAPAQDVHSTKYDADGYDADGYDREGYDRNEKDRNGYDKYPF